MRGHKEGLRERRIPIYALRKLVEGGMKRGARERILEGLVVSGREKRAPQRLK